MRVDIEEEGGVLVMTRPWRGLAAVAYAVVLPVLLFIMVLIISLLWSGRDPGSKAMAIFLALLSLANVYLAILLLVNVTTVELSRDELSTSFGPLPFPGGVSVPRARITAVDVEALNRWPWNAVTVKLKDGGEVRVFASSDPEEAEFVQAQLMARIGR